MTKDKYEKSGVPQFKPLSPRSGIVMTEYSGRDTVEALRKSFGIPEQATEEMTVRAVLDHCYRESIENPDPDSHRDAVESGVKLYKEKDALPSWLRPIAINRLGSGTGHR